MSPDQMLPIAAGAALGVAAAVAALAVIIGRQIAREGAETRRLMVVERTRLGALVERVERERRGQ